jgi:hypothetical protein
VYISSKASLKKNPHLFEYHLDINKNLGIVDRITKDWETWKITNFEFLSILNSLAGRSFKDLTQYPVFPWVIKDYTNKDGYKQIRDLTKPIGVLVIK